jgi:hypothetical protein
MVITNFESLKILRWTKTLKHLRFNLWTATPIVPGKYKFGHPFLVCHTSFNSLFLASNVLKTIDTQIAFKVV